MLIKRIYNNNIILTVNEDNEEIIMTGKGIAFGLDKGDVVPKNKIEKQFKLEGEAKYKFQQLIKDTPLDYILASEEIISYVKEQGNKKLSDTIYITLTDHIMYTVERIKRGIEFDNALLWNIKQLYQQEYKLGLVAVDMLSKRFHLKIDDNEANFIALHIINAQLDSDMMQIYTITEIIDQILLIVKKNFIVDTKDNFAYDRFITHCRFFVQRVLTNYKSENDSNTNASVLTIVCENYKEQAACVEEICNLIEGKYSYKVNQDERLYLMIHMNKLTG